jgi:hypothetical protein
MTKRRSKHNTPLKQRDKPRAFGHVFDSGAERDRYLFLRAAEEQGRIAGLRVHPKYVLVDAWDDALGENYPDNTRRARITYTADFEYLDAGRLVIEDVKGYWRDASRLRWKLLAKMMPNVLRRIVKSPTEPIGYDTE